MPERPAISLRSKAIIDPCRPLERYEEFTYAIYTSPELIQGTAKKWGANPHLREKNERNCAVKRGGEMHSEG